MNSSCSFHLFIFAAFIFLQCQFPTGAATCHPDDEAGLLAFKAGITEDPLGRLSSWKKGTDCCSTWRDVICQNSDRVTLLYLDGNQDEEESFSLSGTISPSLVKLQHLERFYLINLKNITGSFPQFLFQLPKLESIVIQNNRLSGPLPANIKPPRELTVFAVGKNRFTGPIPISLSKIPWLSILDLSGNLLTGTIPLEFANIKQMGSLDLSDNHLSGTIPDIFKPMSSLRHLILSRNRFSGELPPSIALLPPILTDLQVGQNNLTGSFPDYISRLESLDTLDLSSNQFSGTVPESLSKLTSIAYLNLSHNQFSGTLPKSLSKLTKISKVDLSHNLLTGPLPVWNSVNTLDMSYNKFQLKTIPKWLTSAQGIYSLKLAKCGIKMRLDDWKPKEISYYEYIDLSDNQILGSPARFLKAEYMRVFRASGNKLRFDFGNLNFSTTLETLDLSRNLVFGKVPAAVAGLRTLNLSQNHLCGKLPVTKFPANVFAGNDCLCGSPLPPCKL